MGIEVERSGEETIVRVSGVFDVFAAARLTALLVRGATTDGARVVIDFSRVREISDVALATLVDHQDEHQVRLRLRGLSQRHNRMLRYLGRGATAKV